MQTLVAYALHRPEAGPVTRSGPGRVAGWYTRLWAADVTATALDGATVGLHLWDRRDPSCRWPVWQQDGDEAVATTGVPLGADRLLGGMPPERAAVPLARQLAAEPRGVLDLTAPFVLAHVDRRADRLVLHTDALGVGRLFELQTPDGWFWSNRPLAACLFAGVSPRADRDGWRLLASCDWAMGDTTAYDGVRAVPAATQVRADASGCRATSLDLLDELTSDAGHDPLTGAGLDEAAQALVTTARAVAQVWPDRPALGLSGGRDSRLVVAAFLAAGVDVALTTTGDIEGEAETARALVAALPRRVEHAVVLSSAALPTAQTASGLPAPPQLGAIERARRWHDVAEGLRPSQYLRSSPPRRLLAARVPPIVSGAGGDVGHGAFYPSDVLRLESVPVERRREAWVQSVMARLVLPTGVSAAAHGRTEQQVREILEHAETRGHTDATAISWFYVDERLRRWGMSAERAGTVVPLMTTAFLRAAFAMTTAQRRDSALHRALVAHLVPQWADIPFFRATLAQRQAAPVRRLWADADRDRVTGLLEQAAPLADCFDVPTVRHVWRRALEGDGGQRDEQLVQRAVWRAVFDDHLAAVTGRPVQERAALVLAPPSALRPRRRLVQRARALAMRGNDVPLARRLARSRLGRGLRRRLGV